MSPPEATALLHGGFIVLSVLMVAGLLWAVRTVGDAEDARRRRDTMWGALGALLIMGVSAGLAAGGLLAHFDTQPPRPVPVLLVGLLTVILFARGRVGIRLAEGLPLWLLVGFQAFRVPVEILIHRAAVEGVAPPQLTWEGLNFDIITGVTAVAVALTARRGSARRGLLFAWNIMGLGLLTNVVVVAILSMPTPIQRFTPDNTWVAFFPFIWLPMVLVAMALLGHLLLFRRLATSA